MRNQLGRFAVVPVLATIALLAFVPPALANDPPTCEDRSYTFTAGVGFPLPLNSCTDPDGPGSISYSLVTSPAHGTISPPATYTASPSYSGPDSFTYRGTDGAGAQSAPATISITVEAAPPYDPPSCPGGGPLTTGSAVAVALPPCTDDEAFPLQYEGFATFGSLIIRNGLPYYRSQVGYTGPDTITYRARDRFGVYSAPVDVEIFVDPSLPANSAPACPDSNVFVPLGESVVLKGNCADPDGDPISYSLGQLPTAGSLQILSLTSVRYTPNGSAFTDSFTYGANDGIHATQGVTVSITILPAGSNTFPPAPPEPTAAEPFVPSVEVPGTGSVSIDTRSTTATPPTGYNLLDQEFDITYEGPDGTVEAPLRITFAIDSSVTAPSITPIRDGVPVPPCTGPPDQASPNPCHEPMVGTVGQDRSITVLTTHASLWTLGVARVPFGGFLAPVNNAPTMNLATAGQAIPVKFSLGSNLGLDIFAEDFPKARTIDCATGSETDAVESTVTAGSSSLSYDPATNVYTYVWKTQKAWAGTCQRLLLAFSDGGASVYHADFQFKKK